MVQSDEFDATKSEFEMAANPLKQFIDECCIVNKQYKEDGQPICVISAKAFREKYVQWCNEKGYEAMAENKLGREMKHLGFENKRKRNVSGLLEYAYIGVTLEIGKY